MLAAPGDRNRELINLSGFKIHCGKQNLPVHKEKKLLY
jgi:hypothetical protein